MPQLDLVPIEGASHGNSDGRTRRARASWTPRGLPAIQRAEVDAAARKRPTSLSAYDLYLRALPCLHRMTGDGLEEALELLYRALALEPAYSAAAAVAAVIRGYRIAAGRAHHSADLEERLRLIRLAVETDPNDLDVLGHCSRQLAFGGADFDGATEMADRAASMYPNSAFAWNQRGWVYMYCARPGEAVDFFRRAIGLAPATRCNMTCFVDWLSSLSNSPATVRRSKQPAGASD